MNAKLLDSARLGNSAFGSLKDVTLALTNVCFEGKNGHDAGMTPFPLMTPVDVGTWF